jgi:hypothetical protein
MEPLLELGGQSLPHDQVDMFTALEVAVDVRLGQADFARNVGETQIFQSIFLEEVHGGEEDRLLAFFDLVGAAGPSGRGAIWW